MPKKIDMHGHRFDRLTVIRPSLAVNRVTRWECQCDCGSIVVVSTDSLRQGKTKSCGCLKRDKLKERMSSVMRTHGATGTKIYRIWSTMWQRCTNPKNAKYPRYGGRGVKVCSAWEDFLTFVKDVGHRPSPSHTLDRINTDGNYEPENVRWATQVEQQNNRRNNRILTVNGEKLTNAQAARKFGIRPSLLIQRMDRDGMSVEEAITKKVVSNGKRGFEIMDVVV